MSAPLPKLLQREEDSRKNWVAINQLITAQAEAQKEIRLLREIVKRRARGDFNTVLEAFEVYFKPLSRYPESEKSGVEDTWWRTFHVAPGLTNFVATADCADTDLDGIEVPASTALFYIWVDFTDPDAPIVMHTTIAGLVVTHWSEYPALPDGIRPIAKIVTTDSRATITQLQQGNIWPSGSGGGAGWV